MLAILSSCLPKNKQWNYILALNAGPGKDVIIKQAVGCYIRQIPKAIYFRGGATQAEALFSVLKSSLRLCSLQDVLEIQWKHDPNNRTDASLGSTLTVNWLLLGWGTELALKSLNVPHLWLLSMRLGHTKQEVLIDDFGVTRLLILKLFATPMWFHTSLTPHQSHWHVNTGLNT